MSYLLSNHLIIWDFFLDLQIVRQGFFWGILQRIKIPLTDTRNIGFSFFCKRKTYIWIKTCLIRGTSWLSCWSSWGWIRWERKRTTRREIDREKWKKNENTHGFHYKEKMGKWKYFSRNQEKKYWQVVSFLYTLLRKIESSIILKSKK